MKRRPQMALLLAALLVTAVAAGAKESVLPFVQDDYPKALAEARQRGVPIFLEAWAPWCHVCRSMQSFVYTDAKLAPYTDRFVWLAIDTEKPGNAPTVAKYPVGAWPSMYVIDPASETVTYRWTGSATIDQLTRFLDEARPAVAAGASGAAKREAKSPAAGATAASPLDVALARADKLYGAAAWGAAADGYAAAVEHAPDGWPSLPRAADAYMFALAKTDRTPECVSAARRLLPRLAGSPSSATVAAYGLDCAIELEAAAPERAAAIAEFEKAVAAGLQDTKLGLSADDRSGLYASLISAREDAKDAEGERRLEKEWVAMLEEAAAKAPNPEARAVFDSHRLSAYLEIGEPQRAVDMLLQSERDFPDDYNPPARLAAAYRELGQYDKAIAASDRALARVYGPRRLDVLGSRAHIQSSAGDKEAAKATLTQAIAEGEKLPEGHRSERQLARLRKFLEMLSAPAPS